MATVERRIVRVRSRSNWLIQWWPIPPINPLVIWVWLYPAQWYLLLRMPYIIAFEPWKAITK